ncbi:hypothetical protein BBJ28_00000812 [Nothophytophthora sp. Chile5]|nr:hypothetical protein BBJ28_00000812 [Nothophytophthora sp. Chile5]
MLALGVYFSALLEYWLRFCPHLAVEKLQCGKQIVSPSNRTVGQLKFLFRCHFNQIPRDFHVESSVKFFLLNPLDNKATSSEADARVHSPRGNDVYTPLEQFVGPHLGENLAWRVQEVDRKLAMCRGDSVQSWLKENYSDQVQSHIVLRGYLFHPLSHFASTAEVTAAHDWQFHRNPQPTKDASTGFEASCNPSIAADHLQGWWTADFEAELPAKALGRSRFVVLPKLHWLSPVVAIEDPKTGRTVIEGDEGMGIPRVETLTLQELLAFVKEHFQTLASSVKTEEGGVAMPLLIAELVRCCQPIDAEAHDGIQRWRELSRGFILDPKCWDPSPLCHEPVRFRRTVRRSVITGSGEREYTGRPSDWVADGVIKPSIAELPPKRQLNHHEFADPATVRPRDLCQELLMVLRAEEKLFSHADLKRSTEEVLVLRRQQVISIASDSDGGTGEATYLRACLEFLILGGCEADTRLTQRVGYLLLDVFENLRRGSIAESDKASLPDDLSDWVTFLKEVACEEARWAFLNLVLRAIDLATYDLNRAIRSSKDQHSLQGLLNELLTARSTRWNAVAVEMIRVFRLDDPMYSLNIQAMFEQLVEQQDWQNAELLASLKKDIAMLQSLYRQLSTLSMSKALKRLRKVFSELQDATGFPTSMAVQGAELGNPIDNLKNRAIINDSVAATFKWQYVASIQQLDEVVRCLEALEADVLSSAKAADEQTVKGKMLVGLDCEWRPQFLTEEKADGFKVEEANDFNSQGLSIYQLAVGNVVFVVDVQVLGAAAAAPLAFIWKPSPCLVLVGFSVSSDLKRIEQSFPGLMKPHWSTQDEVAEHDAPLLVELKHLALFRHVPASKWGLSRLYHACLGEQVDKEQQCSDWSSRPLSQSQLLYAANDAHAVRRLAIHLLADISFVQLDTGGPLPDRVVQYMKRFAAADSPSFWRNSTRSTVLPLEKEHVKAALRELGLAKTVDFLKCEDGLGQKDGLLVKSIALLVRKRKRTAAALTINVRYAVAVLQLDRSIDLKALGVLLEADPEEISLADQEVRLQTLISDRDLCFFDGYATVLVAFALLWML